MIKISSGFKRKEARVDTDWVDPITKEIRKTAVEWYENTNFVANDVSKIEGSNSDEILKKWMTMHGVVTLAVCSVDIPARFVPGTSITDIAQSINASLCLFEASLVPKCGHTADGEVMDAVLMWATPDMPFRCVERGSIIQVKLIKTRYGGECIILDPTWISQHIQEVQ